MVLLAAAICTKSGKALVSRQFVEMTRGRIEGLLASFPKLIGSGTKQHTFIETESVRYVYQALDKLYMLLITTKASNILEDLETLRLFSRVIPEYCRTIDEKEINEHCFELVFAFDEVVALGYRENVNLAQIRTFTDMESHEEKVYKAMRKTQEKEAKQKMMERAEEIRKARIQAEKSGTGGRYAQATTNYSSGFGNSSSSYNSGGASSSSSSSHMEPSAYESTPPSFSSSLSSSSSSKPNRAMKLGSNKDALPAFIEQQIKSVNTPTPSSSSSSNQQITSSSSSSSSSNQIVESVHVKIEEKLSLTCGKDGGVQNLELLGVLFVKISDESAGRVRVMVKNGDERNLQMQTNPNIDKNLFKSNSIIGLRDPTKSFPISTEIGVLKWRYQCQEDDEIPLTINCWPSETKQGCDVSIEYELQKSDLVLENVVIVVPVPSNMGAPPVIKQIDGDYSYEKFKNCLLWRLGTIDDSNSTGSIDFSCAGHPTDFFPINVNFISHTSYCNIEAVDVIQADNTETPVKHSKEIQFIPEKYEIV